MRTKHFFLLAAFGMMAVACGNTDNPLERETATVSISLDDLKLFVGDSESRLATSSSGGEITFTSSDESVATVDETGKVTGVGVGTATITAIAAPTDKFMGGNASYKVIVSKIDARLNPLYYMAEYNVQSYSVDGSDVTVTFDEGNPTSATGKTLYLWSDAMSKFAKQDDVYNEYWDGHSDGKTITDGSTQFYYHLPCVNEWSAIIPSDFGDANPNIFKATEFVSGGGLLTTTDYPKCFFGYNDETKTTGILECSYWNNISDDSDVRYAIRFLGTQHCSVWKYQIKENGTFEGSTDTQYALIITAKLIDQLEKDDATLGDILEEYMAKDDEWWDYNNENAGALQRKIYSLGSVGTHTSGDPDPSNFSLGCYWSTTEGNRGQTGNTAEARALQLGNKNANIGSHTRTDYYKQKFSVRLFRE